MCVTPLKGFINENKQVIKVANKNAEFVRFIQGKVVTFYDKSLMLDGDYGEYIDIPCRSCAECYSDMRREWIARATAEMQLHEKAIFVTLTYKDYNDGVTVLPPEVEMITSDGEILKHQTLRYRDFQLFMKRLRKAFPDNKIRYMVCGEYGSKTFRPHYHCILYGLGLEDFGDMIVHNRNSQGDYLYSSVSLDNIWTNGYTLSSGADNATIAYVAGYVAKKFTSMRSKDWYAFTNVVAPFIKSSNKPGLGAEWFYKNIDGFENEYDYKMIPAISVRSTPTKVYLTSTWKHKFLNKNLNSFNEVNDYDLKKCVRRFGLYDKRFNLLRTDKGKSEYNASQNYNFRKSFERKRGVY